MKDIKKVVLLRTSLVYVGIILFGLAIIGKAIYIQYADGDALMEKAKKQEMRLAKVEALRGNIYADDGTLLATSVPIFDIRMDVSSGLISDTFFSQNVDSLSRCLSMLFKDRKPSDYRDMLWEARRNGERNLLIKRDITYPELKQVKRFPILNRGKYKGGMIVNPHYRRELPFKNLAMRTIGFESEEAESKVYVGLEGSFSKNLQGVDGQRLMRRVGSSTWVPVDIENLVEPQNGDDIITTIDINLQDMVESALHKELVMDSADHGCAIVMEVKTGHIKAIANLGRTAKGTYEEIYNYAIGESTEPGSTFKLASFLVALEDGKVALDRQVNTGSGVVVFAGRQMKDSHKGYGILTAMQVFEKSSNVGTSKLIYEAYAGNPQQYIDGLYRLSIHKPLNLQIAGEGRPYIKNTRDRFWSAVSLPWMSIGYEVALTPLQLLTLYNAVANNGKMVKPLFVKEIRRNGQVIQVFSPFVINPSICSPATIEKARILLEGVVKEGTATAISTPLYQIAGKTGTAQVAQNNKGYNQGTKSVKYKGSFIGYFPADDPQYSIIIVINDPSKGKYYGASIAAPVFREISDRVYSTMDNIQNPVPYALKRDPAPRVNPGTLKDIENVFSLFNLPVNVTDKNVKWVKPVGDSTGLRIEPVYFVKGSMPDVRGMGIKDAVYILEQSGLRVILNGKGTVVRQSIQPGTSITKGGIVFIDLAT